jgi:hypothetical protein
MDSPASTSSSLEDNLVLPEYAQNLLPELELPTLVLISHGHSPPLKPEPQLRFDVRSLPNPPKHIRDAHNGTSKRLQEWMQTDAKFLARRDAIKSEIETAMMLLTAAHEKKDILRLEPQHGEWTGDGGGHASALGQQGEVECREAARNDEKKWSPGQDSADEDDDDPRDQADTLRVGIYCAMGRHRSVAMVEELAKLSWPGWCVEVEHRDISKKRGVGKKFGGKDNRRSRGGTIPPQFDDNSE